MIADLVAAGARETGLAPATVESLLGEALALLDRHAARDRLAALYAAAPGAEELARRGKPRPPRAGLFAGLMRSAGGASGAAVADAMGLLERAAASGVDKATLKRLLKAAEAQAADAGKGDVLALALDSVPGVGTLLRARRG